jgi:hypothetical protein
MNREQDCKERAEKAESTIREMRARLRQLCFDLEMPRASGRTHAMLHGAGSAAPGVVVVARDRRQLEQLRSEIPYTKATFATISDMESGRFRGQKRGFVFDHWALAETLRRIADTGLTEDKTI